MIYGSRIVKLSQIMSQSNRAAVAVPKSDEHDLLVVTVEIESGGILRWRSIILYFIRREATRDEMSTYFWTLKASCSCFVVSRSQASCGEPPGSASTPLTLAHLRVHLRPAGAGGGRRGRVRSTRWRVEAEAVPAASWLSLPTASADPAAGSSLAPAALAPRIGADPGLQHGRPGELRHRLHDQRLGFGLGGGQRFLGSIQRHQLLRRIFLHRRRLCSSCCHGSGICRAEGGTLSRRA